MHRLGMNLIVRGLGGGCGRIFGIRGEPRLLLLTLIDDHDRKGYELTNAIDEMAGGDCALSPRVACLTLALPGHFAKAPIAAEGEQPPGEPQKQARVDQSRRRLGVQIPPAGLQALGRQPRRHL